MSNIFGEYFEIYFPRHLAQQSPLTSQLNISGHRHTKSDWGGNGEVGFGQ